MKLEDIFRIAVQAGRETDPRGEERIGKELKAARSEYDELKEKMAVALGGGQFSGIVRRGAEEAGRGAKRAIKSGVKKVTEPVKKRLSDAVRKAMQTEIAIA